MNPDLPAAIGNLNLSMEIAMNQLIVYQHFCKAKAISATLKALQSE
jgi:hypothetical protein